ncbi:MAG: hypothetical protein ACK5K7_05165 [Bacilli bacterium]
MLNKFRVNSMYNYFIIGLLLFFILMMLIIPVAFLNSSEPATDDSVMVNVIIVNLCLMFGFSIFAILEMQYMINSENIKKCAEVLEQYRRDDLQHEPNIIISKKLFMFGRSEHLAVIVFNSQKLTMFEFKVRNLYQELINITTLELKDIYWKYDKRKRGYIIYIRDIGNMDLKISNKKSVCFINQFKYNEKAYENFERVITSKFNLID